MIIITKEVQIIQIDSEKVRFFYDQKNKDNLRIVRLLNDFPTLCDAKYHQQLVNFP